MNADSADSLPSISEEDELNLEHHRERREKKEKCIIPPSHLPWEYGSNRYASQKGMSAFGSPRGVVTKVTTSIPNLPAHATDNVIPKLTGGASGFQNPRGFLPFGDTRDVVLKTQEHNRKKPVNKAGIEKETDTFLSKWAAPNPVNKNTAGFGGRRQTTIRIEGTKIRDRRGEGVLPKLQRANSLPGVGASFVGPRQITLKVEGGLEMSDDDQKKSKAALPWATGKLAVQTQSGTGGFLKPRDVCNQTYYDEKKPMSAYRFF